MGHGSNIIMPVDEILPHAIMLNKQYCLSLSALPVQLSEHVKQGALFIGSCKTENITCQHMSYSFTCLNLSNM